MITRSEPGGAQSHVLELLKGFKEQYELVLATGEEGFLLDEAINLDIRTYLISSMQRNPSPGKDYKAYKEIVAALKESRPDLVHCHSSKAGILGRLAAHKLGIKTVFTAHGWSFAEGTPLSRKLIGLLPERLLAYWTDCIITVSDTDRDLAIRYRIGRPEKIVTIHNGIADQALPTVNKDDARPVELIMVARFAAPKYYAQLIDAAATIKANFRLRLVGDGPLLEPMKKRAEDLNLSDIVEFLGSRDDVDELLAGSDVFILVSDWEGFPISILEAMRAGLPVIACNVGGIHEAIPDHSNGRLVPRGEIAGLKLAMQELISDRALRLEMGAQSRQRFEQLFTTAIMLKKIEVAYRSLGINGPDARA
ncbi:MAG: glycosyltransferase family 4 protein [Pseudomonadota bacterium]|nr:glycosyltransferase family 4 protein [Pseudomonadota bacterium]